MMLKKQTKYGDKTGESFPMFCYVVKCVSVSLQDRGCVSEVRFVRIIFWRKKKQMKFGTGDNFNIQIK